jgi:hypothetical protein
VKLLAQTGLLVCKRRQSRPETEVPVEVLGKRPVQIGQLEYKRHQRRPEIEVLVILQVQIAQLVVLVCKLHQRRLEIEVPVQCR